MTEIKITMSKDNRPIIKTDMPISETVALLEIVKYHLIESLQEGCIIQ